MASILEPLVEAILPPVTRGVGVAMPYLHSLTVQGTVLDAGVLRAEALGTSFVSAPMLSANDIIRTVQTLGLPIRRQSALQAIKAMRSQVQGVAYIKSLSGGRLPLSGNIPFTATRQRLKYQYTIRVKGIDMETGLQNIGYVRINSTRLLTKNQATARAMAEVDFGTSAGLLDVSGADVIMITRQNPNIVNA